MPTSAPYCIPIIAHVARQFQPASVLDVGVGFGKYGWLFREYTDIWDIRDIQGYDKSRWKTRIDGVEASPQYLSPLHDFLYDHIYVGDVVTVIDQLGRYDVTMMGDVLEHFEKEIGRMLIDKLLEHTNQCLLIATPAHCKLDDHRLENPYESHRSAWDRKDFRRFPQAQFKLVEGYTALVAITKPPHKPPLLTASFAARRRSGWKGVMAWLMTRSLGCDNASRLASWLAGQRITLRA